MFWKTAGSSRHRVPHRPSISITHRLTVTYTLITFAMLAVTISALYYALLKSLEEEDRLFLAEKISRLSAVLSTGATDREALEREIEKGSELSFIKYHIHVLDSRGRTVAETRSPGREMLHGLVQDIAVPARGGPAVTRKKLSGDQACLVMSARAGPGSRYTIHAVLDVSREVGIVRRYRYMAETILAASIFISAAAGALLARRAMRPLARITAVVQTITATRLSDRVTPHQWPRELTALAMAFDSMLDRLQESFARLSHYSADLAHELRTPINNLIGEAEVMLAKSRSPLEYQQNIESSLEEYIRLRHMVDSLLFLARAESTDIRVEQARLDGAAELRAAADCFIELFQEKRLSLRISGGAVFRADRQLLRRALSNVLANALRYTPEGGSVSIAIKRDERGATVIAVADTGVGIRPEDIPNIFNRFFRAASARTLDAAGSGLGLAIVKSIMDLHGGTVAIESAPGRGTTVTLAFPQTA